MKLLTTILLLAATVATCSPAENAPTPASGDMQEITDFGDNPGQLKAWQYLPEGLPEQAALVVVLHGCGQNAAEMARLTGWNALAAQQGFAVLYPEQQASNNIQNCFNWFQQQDITRSNGESQSIWQMVSYMLSNYNIAPKRIYLTGMSAGGAMSSALMAAYPDVFSAGAVQSGVPYGAAFDLAAGFQAMQGQVSKSPEAWQEAVANAYPSYEGAYPKAMIFHGTDDAIVNAQNAEELAKQWGAVHQTGRTPAAIDTTFAGNPAVRRLSYQEAGGEERVVRFDIEGLGHAMAVDPGEGEQQGGETGPFAKDVDFYATYWIARFFGLL
ncbi:extracellular catalytic domain type 1 short-chain-length polyhydroxyalkanoate depolymerase [Phaeodactylibacter luteus]|uniref:PHB depolymerase family esterase n=1 Tax=Phaeodactylibacter luteus TaxID=1564516 RepID=A0A5C6RJ87_9BACT|nr:PHB depolymerase family esterase [Phaeodactylibacter luteus]TXB62183.1 PHB depolymerase family esterase [Phaeodactylibacter luteus]